MYDPIRQFRDRVHVSDSGGAMKREDLLNIAAEIFDYGFRENTPQFDRIERFAKRIAEHEREECVEICIDQSIRFCEAMNGVAAYGSSECEKAIRARSE